MLENFRYHRQLRKLQRERDAALAVEDKCVSEAQASKDQDSYQSALADLFMVRDEHDERIGRLVTRHYREKAERYMLPWPDYDDDRAWLGSNWGPKYLSAAAVTDLKRLLREESSHRASLIMGVLGTLAAVGGVIVAILALLLDGSA